MVTECKRYTAEFKREAVRMNTEGGVPLAQVSRELGVCRSLLGKWKQQKVAAQETGVRAFPGYGRPADEELAR